MKKNQSWFQTNVWEPLASKPQCSRNHFSEQVGNVKLASDAHDYPSECEKEILAFYLIFFACVYWVVFSVFVFNF